MGYSKEKGVTKGADRWALQRSHPAEIKQESCRWAKEQGGPQGEESACTKRQRPARRALRGQCSSLQGDCGAGWRWRSAQRPGQARGRQIRVTEGSGVQLRALRLRELLEAFQRGRATSPAQLCSGDELFQTHLGVGLCSPHHPLHALAHAVHGEPSPHPLTKSYSSLRPNSSLNPGIKPFVTTPAQTFLLFRRCFHSYGQNPTPKERQGERCLCQ